MKRRMRMALWLYPRGWRGRYEREFTALLEDAGSGWRECWDVARGGLTMRLRTWNFANVSLAAAVLGAVAACAWSTQLKKQYVANAAVVVRGGAAGGGLPTVIAEAINSKSLHEIMTAKGLYAAERGSGDSTHIFRRDISVVAVTGQAPGDTPVIKIAYRAADPNTARDVTNELSNRLAEKFAGSRVVDPAELPGKASSPDRIAITLAGLAAGFGFGAIVFAIGRLRHATA